MAQSYVERAPWAELAGVVRTVWVQRTDENAYVQRHLPTGGVELHFPIGGRPRLVGPLTGAMVEVLPPHTTLVGVRFLPGRSPRFSWALDDLVDARVALDEIWDDSVDRLAETMAAAAGADAAVELLQAHLVRLFRRDGGPDPLVAEAARLLMPWHPIEVTAVAEHLAISTSQLRRRCLRALGVGPKTLQRTLRFQGYLALAQAGAVPRGIRDTVGIAGLAADVGYADQAHLGRECVRLAGLTPRELLGGGADRCGCGHDHAASYRPFLATRRMPPLRT